MLAHLSTFNQTISLIRITHTSKAITMTNVLKVTFEALLAHLTKASSLTSNIRVRDAKLKISIFLSMSVFL